MTTEKIDELIENYIVSFDEEPLVVYPGTLYEGVYVKLMKKALDRGSPYTEEELNKALDIVKYSEEGDIY